jgi:hypothetical protein
MGVHDGQWSTDHRGLYWNGTDTTSILLPLQIASLCSTGFSLEIWVKIDDVIGQGVILEWLQPTTTLLVMWFNGKIQMQLINTLTTLAVSVPIHLPVNHIVLTSKGQLWVNGQNSTLASLSVWLQVASWWNIGVITSVDVSPNRRQHSTRMSGSGGSDGNISVNDTNTSQGGNWSTTNNYTLNTLDDFDTGRWLLELGLFNYSMTANQIGLRHQALQQEFPPLVCPPRNQTVIFIDDGVDTDSFASQVWFAVLPPLRTIWTGIPSPLWPSDWQLQTLGPGEWTTLNRTLHPQAWMTTDDEWQWRGNTSRSFVTFQFAGESNVCRLHFSSATRGRSRYLSVLPVADIWWVLGIVGTAVVLTMLYFLHQHRRDDRVVRRLLFKGASLHAAGVAVGFIVIDNLYYRDLLDESEAQAWYTSFAVLYMMEALYEISAYVQEGWTPHLAPKTARHRGVTVVRLAAEMGNLMGAAVYLYINLVHGLSTPMYTQLEIMGMMGYGCSGLGYLLLTIYEHYNNGWFGAVWEAEVCADTLNTAACSVYTTILFQQIASPGRGHRHKREFQWLAFSSGYLFLTSAVFYVFGSFV